ncbi:hypothetical protein GGR56DRAFT_653005 [Xylariaceae sp. FL0804]|nr:hypothetical protein GGR56DRAFT_653005 [Xylariaceae sp. FL0804]
MLLATLPALPAPTPAAAEDPAWVGPGPDPPPRRTRSNDRQTTGNHGSPTNAALTIKCEYIYMYMYETRLPPDECFRWRPFSMPVSMITHASK